MNWETENYFIKRKWTYKKANNSELIRLFLIFKGEKGNWIEKVKMILERASEPIKKSNKYKVNLWNSHQFRSDQMVFDCQGWGERHPSRAGGTQVVEITPGNFWCVH